MERKTTVLEIGWSCLMRVEDGAEVRRVRVRWARTMAMGKTMPMRPLVRTLRAQQAAKASRGVGLVVGSDLFGEPVADRGLG